MAEHETLNEEQLIIPFTDLTGDLGVPDNYDFKAIKTYYKPKNPLMEFPLFLSKSKTVNDSRKRYKHLANKKNRGISPPDMSVNALSHKIGPVTIVADPDLGLPDEFDGEVHDCIMMLISKIYHKKQKAHVSYRIDETAIMNEFVKRGYKRGGTLYGRIKDSFNRIKLTNYKYKEEIQDSKGKVSYIEMSYSLISELYRRGEIHPDGKEISHTLIVPNSLTIESIKNKEYRIEDNEIRYKLHSSYHAKEIYDLLHNQVSAEILSRQIYISIKAKTFPFWVIDYHTLCNKVGIIPLKGVKLKASNISESFLKFRNSLVDNDVLIDIHVEKKNTVEKRFKLVFIINPNFVDVVFNKMNRKMNMQNIDNIGNKEISAYFAMMEKMISTRKIKNFIKKRES